MHDDIPTPPRATSPSSSARLLGTPSGSARFRNNWSMNAPGAFATTPAASSQAMLPMVQAQAMPNVQTVQNVPAVETVPSMVDYNQPQVVASRLAATAPALQVAMPGQPYEMVPLVTAPVQLDHDQTLPPRQSITSIAPAATVVVDNSAPVAAVHTQTPPVLQQAYHAQLVQQSGKSRVIGGPYAEALESGMVGVAPSTRLPTRQEVFQAQITTAPEMPGQTYVAEAQVVPGTTQTVHETRQGQPIDPIYLPPEPAPPIHLPMQRYVDRLRPFPAYGIPVYSPAPAPVYQPTPVTHTFKQFAPHYDHDFPYHDPAFGSGWRFHYPDNLDEALLNMGTYKPTPLEDMRHAAYESQMKEEWINAHVAESQYGVRHRHLPFSRRVRLPERLIPDPEDYSEIIL